MHPALSSPQPGVLRSLASLPALPHQTCFISALPSSPEPQRKGENELNYADVLGQCDHPLVHALDALAGLQGLALGLGAIRLPEVLQVGCFRSRGLERAWERHKEESRREMSSVSPFSNAIPAQHWGTASKSWVMKPLHASSGSPALAGTASPCPHLAVSASGHAPRAPSPHPAAAWPLSHGTGWASSRDSLLPSAQGCSLRESLGKREKRVKTRSSPGFSLVLWQPSLVGRVTCSAKGGEKR